MTKWSIVGWMTKGRSCLGADEGEEVKARVLSSNLEASLLSVELVRGLEDFKVRTLRALFTELLDAKILQLKINKINKNINNILKS